MNQRRTINFKLAGDAIPPLDGRASTLGCALALLTLLAITPTAFAAGTTNLPRGNTKTYQYTYRFEPPQANFSAPALPRAITEDLRQSAWADAASHVDLLLQDHAGELMTTDDDGLISAGAWVDAIPTEQRRQWRGQAPAAETAALQQLDPLRQDVTTKPEAFYALAWRYPGTKAAGAALLEAGDRAARLGDAPATATYYALAIRAGATLDG